MPRETLSDRELAGLLDEQIEAMQAVREALEDERRALVARDGDALVEAVNVKSRTLAAADALARRTRAGRGSGDAGLGQRWQQVVMLTEQCRALNEANGQMIRGQHRRVEGVLRLLRGDTSAPVEYGPAGERRARAGQRLLGSY
jgi:flagellar biosynthesis/type III secretory pathway chaperone